MLRTTFLTIAFAFAAASAAQAQLPPQPPPVTSIPSSSGNDQERAACHPDVMRYCKEQIKDNQDDVFAILACLEKNRAKISQACNIVLLNHSR